VGGQATTIEPNRYFSLLGESPLPPLFFLLAFASHPPHLDFFLSLALAKMDFWHPQETRSAGVTGIWAGLGGNALPI